MLRQEFEEKGYVILKGFFSKEEAENLLENIKIAQQRYEDNLTRGAMVFRTVVFFRSKEIQEFLAQQKIIDVLSELIGPDIWVRWDQAVAKGPGADTFPWHQDNGYNKLQDIHYQFWISLTKTTVDNGGLLLVPGSHKQALPHKQVGAEWVYDGVPENSVLIEADPGDVVIFSSFLLHSTTPNVTQETRWAYVPEYMSLDHYDPDAQSPYFVVARDGKSCPEFVKSYRGKQNLKNRIKYLPVTASPTRLARGAMRRIKKLQATLSH
jgi:hypothetical protein